MLASDGDTHMVHDRIYKLDMMRMISLVFSELRLLPTKTIRSGKGYSSSEARFSAPITRFNRLATKDALQESIVSFYHINKNDLSESQRMSIMAAASVRDASSTPVTQRSSVDTFMFTITYDRIASILVQCDIPSVSFPHVNASAAHQQLTIAVTPSLMSPFHN